MKRLIALFIAALVVPMLASAQSVRITPARVGQLVAALPSTCAVGDVVFLTTAPVGLHECKTLNTWTATGSGGGGGAITCLDTGVLFADGADSPACDAGFTYDKTTDTLTSVVGSFTSPGVVATLTTALAGTNNDLVYTAEIIGIAGHGTTIRYLDPAGLNQPLVIDHNNGAITVSLATDGAGVITTTAQQIIDNWVGFVGLINAPTNAPGNSGAGVVAAMAATALSGGVSAQVVTGPSVWDDGTISTDGNGEIRTIDAFLAVSAMNGWEIGVRLATNTGAGRAELIVDGSQTNIDLYLIPKGTGEVGIDGNLSANDVNFNAGQFGDTVTAPYYIGNGSGLSVANVGANSCGTTAATIAGGPASFEITVGATAGTQCRVTLPTAAPNRWNCTANNSTTANLARVTPVDTTNVDFLGTFVAGDVVSGVCIPR